MDVVDPEGVVELDLRGQVCPATLLKSLRQLNRMKEELAGRARELVILTDNRYSTNTVSEAAGSMGYEVTVSKDEAHYRIRVTGPR